MNWKCLEVKSLLLLLSLTSELSWLATTAIDPDASTLIDILVSKAKEAAQTYDLKRSEVVNLVAKFIQTLPCTNKDVTTPYDQYPRYPLETLFEEGGDSQDTSILAAALLSRLDYDVVLFFFESQKHAAVGVNMPGTPGYSWEYKAKRYYYLETMGQGPVLGDCPPEYRAVQALIYPISS